MKWLVLLLVLAGAGVAIWSEVEAWRMQQTVRASLAILQERFAADADELPEERWLIGTVTMFAANPTCQPTQSLAACMSRLAVIDPRIRIARKYLLTSPIVDIEQVGNQYIVQPKDQHVICVQRRAKKRRP